MLNSCPKCKNTDLHIEGSIRATLHCSRDQSGVVQLSLLNWDSVESINSYECLNCGQIFSDEN